MTSVLEAVRLCSMISYLLVVKGDQVDRDSALLSFAQLPVISPKCLGQDYTEKYCLLPCSSFVFLQVFGPDSGHVRVGGLAMCVAD